MPITRTEARNLLRADSVSFHSYFDLVTEEWVSHITAYRRVAVGEDTGFTIGVDDTRMNRYHQFLDETMHNTRSETLTCYVALMFCAHDPRHRTIVRAMAHEGYKVGLRWTRNNQSPVLDGVGFYRDTLDVAVENKRGIVQTFRADEYVGPDNTARMTRYLRRSYPEVS